MWNTHSTGRRAPRGGSSGTDLRLPLSGSGKRQKRRGAARRYSSTASWPKAIAQLADGAVDVDAELVGQAQHLGAEVEHDDRVAGVVAQDPLEALDRQLVERRRREAQRAAAAPGPTSRPWSTSTRWQIRLTRASSRRSRRPLTATTRSSAELVAVLLQRPREQRDLDVRLEVLEHEHRHLVALLGELAGQPGDHAADVDGRRRRRARRGRRSTARPCAAAPPRRRTAGGRTRTARASPSRGAACRSCRTRCRGSAGARRSRRAAPVVGLAAPVAEQAHHALLPLAAAGQRGVGDVLEHAEQALAGVAERVERPGLDQRLDGPLVEHRLGHPLGEVVEAGERAVGVALLEQQGDEAGADVAHGRQPERDRPGAADRQRRRRRAPRSGASAAKSVTERLMSGSSTRMPIARHSAM